jgi:Na+-transporting NADH:ubiquinone oxidoreductase subunit B
LIEKLIDLALTPFRKGQPLERLYPAVQAIETIILTPKDVTPKSGPHIRDAIDLKRFMIMVVVAIMPCALFGIYNTGYQTMTAAGETPDIAMCIIHGMTRFLPLYIVTLAAGGTVEMIFAVIRKHEINEGFLVSSMLFPLILPPTLPLWMAAVGIIFGVIFGKEVFGGTGMNIFNPALTGRCFLFFAYPAQMSGDTSVWIADKSFITYPPSQWLDLPQQVDAVSRATPLASAFQGTLIKDGGPGDYTFMEMFLGNVPGSIGETSALCAIVGAILLISFGIGSYKTMLGTVIGCLATGYIFNAFAPVDANQLCTMPAHYHLVMGGFAFGAVYMATDPVSGPATGTGKWIYGILIGVIVVLIRNINPAYPEGMMLSILFMNLFAPLIDHYIMEARIKRRLARG